MWTQMKRVWKCDFCVQTHVSSIKILEHEPECCFNPVNRKCYSCKNQDGSDYYPLCSKRYNVFKGEEEGNCEGWETDDMKLMRMLKLRRLYE